MARPQKGNKIGRSISAPKKAAAGSSIDGKIDDNNGESETFVSSSVSSSAMAVSNNNNRYIENALNDYSFN